ncbi:hypothetical protein WDZ92_39490, partial [Nostoc sp. NIES-2111]
TAAQAAAPVPPLSRLAPLLVDVAARLDTGRGFRPLRGLPLGPPRAAAAGRPRRRPFPPFPHPARRPATHRGAPLSAAPAGAGGSPWCFPPVGFWMISPFVEGAAAIVFGFSFLGFLASRLPRCSPFAMWSSGLPRVRRRSLRSRLCR